MLFRRDNGCFLNEKYIKLKPKIKNPKFSNFQSFYAIFVKFSTDFVDWNVEKSQQGTNLLSSSLFRRDLGRKISRWSAGVLFKNTLVLNTKMYFFKNKPMYRKRIFFSKINLCNKNYFLNIFAQNVSFFTVLIPQVIVDPPHDSENSF